MGSGGLLWNLTKNYFAAGLVALTMSDRFASLVSVQDDCVLVEKWCFRHGTNYNTRGSPNNHKGKNIKRIIGLPGDWVRTPYSTDVIKVPEGHCWVEGDNPASSIDSRSFGPIPLGSKLMEGQHTFNGLHIEYRRFLE